MILLPAIDIRDGRAVRLRRGDFDNETVYADDALKAAQAWAEAGARALHVVDLDGARRGEPVALSHLNRIASQTDLPVQYGGGLRSVEAVAAALGAGAERVVVGTAALSGSGFLEAALSRFPDRIAAAVDARGGEAAIAGWTEGTGVAAEAVVEGLVARGASRLVYTQVDRDGMLAGPDLAALQRAAGAAGEHARITYSGGVGKLEDLRALGALRLPALEGVISGSALYERRFTIAEGQATLDEATALDRAP